jgi:hypothetical protein
LTSAWQFDKPSFSTAVESFAEIIFNLKAAGRPIGTLRDAKPPLLQEQPEFLVPVSSAVGPLTTIGESDWVLTVLKQTLGLQETPRKRRGAIFRKGLIMKTESGQFSCDPPSAWIK